MSNPFHTVGKVFKKVVKVVKKVALPALMIGAVVLTGGAALGALPAIGSVLGSIGISGTLASVLGGAISMGAVGAVTGGLGGLISGGGLLKGATKGFLAGAATGGVLGGAGVIGANGILGSAGAASSGAIPAPDLNSAINVGVSGAGSGSLIGGAGTVGAAVPTSVATSATTTAAAAGAAQAAGHSALGGILGTGGIGPILQAGGSIISGFAQGKAAEAQQEAELQAQRDKYDRIAFNYGYRNIYGDKHSNIPTSQEQVYAMSMPDFQTPYSSNPGGGLLRTAPSPFIQPSFQYQIVNGQVVPVPIPTAA